MITVKPLAKPEPTVIDESDLADGMVVSMVSLSTGWLYICTPDVIISRESFLMCDRKSCSTGYNASGDIAWVGGVLS
jgi:hypothetical protein